MPDDNRFAGLGEQLDRPEQSDDGTLDETDEVGSSAGSASEQSDTEDELGDGPAFPFDETSAKSLYVRDETLALFEDTEFQVEAVLRSDHEIRNLTSREFHDALVHVAGEHVDEIAERIDAERSDE